MPNAFTGGPDYGISPYLQSAQQQDDANIAAQLQGINLSDSLGRLLYFDDFGDGLAHWLLSSSGGGANPALSVLQGRVWIPPNGVIMSTTNALGATSQMNAQWAVQQSRSIGLEIGWSLRNGSRQWEQWLYYKFPGQSRYTAKLIYDTFAKTVTIDAVSGSVVVATLDDAQFSNGVFVPIKLVVDFDAGLYKRVSIAGRIYDVSSHAIPTDAGVGDYQLLVNLICRQVNAASINENVVGYVAVTFDEPG